VIDGVGDGQTRFFSYQLKLLSVRALVLWL
jgi:hypothetical protein